MDKQLPPHNNPYMRMGVQDAIQERWRLLTGEIISMLTRANGATKNELFSELTTPSERRNQYTSTEVLEVFRFLQNHGLISEDGEKLRYKHPTGKIPL